MLAFGLVVVLILLILFGQPLFVIMGALCLYCYKFWTEDEISVIVEDIFFAADKEILLAIPLFILAGQIMTKGQIAKSLIRVATVSTSFIPSGLAIAAVLSCALFASISGSSPVTLIAVGGLLYPALTNAGYPKEMSLGLLSSGGTLGIIIPPSIPMIVFAIMAQVSVVDLFVAGVGPSAVLVLLLVIYSVMRGGQTTSCTPFCFKEFLSAMRHGVFSLMMPVIILGGIYSGVFTATESAAIAVIYALAVELFVTRDLKWSQLVDALAETAELLGSLFLILILAVSLNKFMTYEQIPVKLVDFFSQAITSKVTFILGVNILLLAVGLFMDALSAILVLAPLLTPLAQHYGMNPVHFGIMMIVNLEIGYITPPVGINLFVASTIFKEPLGVVIKSVLPLIAVLLLGLAIIAFFPDLSLFLLKKD